MTIFEYDADIGEVDDSDVDDGGIDDGGAGDDDVNVGDVSRLVSLNSRSEFRVATYNTNFPSGYRIV